LIKGKEKIMIRISAEFNKADIEALKQTYSGDLIRKAIRSALDKTGTWAKNYIATDVSSNYNLTASKVKKGIEVKRTSQTALEVSVKISGKGLSILDDFGAMQDSIGIKANVSRDKVFSVPHAFINLARSAGKRVIMLRKGSKRYPTTGKPGRGPSIAILANRMAHRDKMDSDLTNHLYQEMEAQIVKRAMGQAPTPMIE
jgi:hypothetical protein